MNKNFIKMSRESDTFKAFFNRSRVGEKEKKEAQQLLIINFKRVGRKEKWNSKPWRSTLMNEECELNN
jgi:hypothetical protein